MSWPGILVVHVPDGVTARQAVDATIEGWIAHPNVPGSHLMAVPDPVDIIPDPDWPTKVREALVGVNPNLRRVDGGNLDDGVGPVMI